MFSLLNACSDAPSAPKEVAVVKVAVEADSQLHRGVFPLRDGAIHLPTGTRTDDFTGRSFVPLSWPRDGLRSLKRGALVTGEAGQELLVTSAPGLQGLRLQLKEGGVERVLVNLDFSEINGVPVLRNLRAQVADIGGRRSLTSWEIPSGGAKHLSPALAAAIARDLQLAADEEEDGPCGTEKRRLLLATAGLVVATATGNPLGVFISTFTVANALHDFASCMERSLAT
jgi:hypothetical protein